MEPTPPVTEKHVVATILEPTHQSQPCKTIHHTYNEKLEGLRCCDILESIRKLTILVWNVGYFEPILLPPMNVKRDVVLFLHDELKSQPCKTIHYTHGERMEGLRCCELPSAVQTRSILVSKVDKGQAYFDPTRDWNSRCGDHYRAHIPISIISNNSLYL